VDFPSLLEMIGCVFDVKVGLFSGSLTLYVKDLPPNQKCVRKSQIVGEIYLHGNEYGYQVGGWQLFPRNLRESPFSMLKSSKTTSKP